MKFKLTMVKCPSDTESIPAHPSTPAPPTLATSEYWAQSTPDALRQEISRRISEPRTKEEVAKALASERLQFKVLWNRSLSINQLPTELLIHIFKLDPVGLIKCLVITFERRTIEKPYPTFWRLMMVCRHWRKVIVGTPAFWSLVDVGSTAEWTELCLSRSLEASLNVYARISHHHSCLEHFRDVYPLVQNRIRSLYLEIAVFSGDMNPDVLAALPLLFGIGMPVVETLDFLVTHDFRRPYHVPVAIDLTCERFPRLRYLALTGVIAPQAASLYRQLQTLSLTTCTYEFSCDHFLGILTSCTGLERLYLQNTLDHLSGGWEHRHAVPWRPLISLPRLYRFSLIDHSPARTSRFLAQFYVGPSVRLSIFVDAEDADVDPKALPSSSGGACSVAAMLPLDHASTLAPFATATRIHMCMDCAYGIEITGSPPGLGLSMRLSPYNYNGYPLRWGTARDLVEFLGCAPLTSLVITQVLPDTVAAWSAVFQTFVCLERLDVEGYQPQTPVGMENLFRGLHAASACGAPGGLLACPGLTHVKVFSSARRTPAMYEAIHACIRHRRDRGAVLVELDLDLLWNWSLYRTHAQDLIDCTERLWLGGRSVDEFQELGAAEAAGVDQGDARPADSH